MGYFFKQNQHSKKSKAAKQDINQSQLLLTEDGHILDMTSDASTIFSKQFEISQYFPALGLTIHRVAVATRGKESKSNTKSINSLQNREMDVSTPGRRRQQQKKEAEALALDEWHHLQLEESGVQESLKRTLFQASRSGSRFSDIEMPQIAISTRCKLTKLQFPRAEKYCFMLKIVWLNPADDDLESRYEPSESNRGFSGYSARVESGRKLAAQWAFEEKQVNQDVEYALNPSLMIDLLHCRILGDLISNFNQYAYLEDFLIDYSAILRDERLLQKWSLTSDKVESTSDSKKRKSLFSAQQDEKKIKKQVLKRNDVVPRNSKQVGDSLENPLNLIQLLGSRLIKICTEYLVFPTLHIQAMLCKGIVLRQLEEHYASVSILRHSTLICAGMLNVMGSESVNAVQPSPSLRDADHSVMKLTRMHEFLDEGNSDWRRKQSSAARNRTSSTGFETTITKLAALQGRIERFMCLALVNISRSLEERKYIYYALIVARVAWMNVTEHEKIPDGEFKYYIQEYYGQLHKSYYFFQEQEDELVSVIYGPKSPPTNTALRVKGYAYQLAQALTKPDRKIGHIQLSIPKFV